MKRRPHWQVIIEDEIEPCYGLDLMKAKRKKLLKFIVELWEEKKNLADVLDATNERLEGLYP